MNCIKILTLILSETDYFTYEKSANSSVSNRSHNLPKTKKHFKIFQQQYSSKTTIYFGTVSISSHNSTSNKTNIQLVRFLQKS